MILKIIRNDGKEFTFEALLKSVEFKPSGNLILHYFNDETFEIENNDYIAFEVK